MTVEVPTYIPLPAAARKFGIAEKVLTRLVQDGKIEAAQLPSGELLVKYDIDPSLNITREQFGHLRGTPISIAEAGRRYKVPHPSISAWVKTGYIRVIKEAAMRGQKKFVDEADVAYCAAVYKAKKEKYDGDLRGVRIFDKDGSPYRLKYPEVAARMRAERRRKRKAATNDSSER